MRNKDIKYGPLSQEHGPDLQQAPPTTWRHRVARMSAFILLILITIVFITALCLENNRTENISIKIQDKQETASRNRAVIYSVEEYINSRTPNIVPKKPETNITKSTSAPLPSPSLSPDPDLGSGSKKIVCYYNYPDSNSSNILQPEDLNCTLCSHIIVAFVKIVNHTLLIDQPIENTVEKLVQLKKCNPELKILISVGGSKNDDGFPDMVKNHANRKQFIGSVRDSLRRLKLDGIDLDWEFPGAGDENHVFANLTDRQRQHFSQLLRELRVEFQREKREYLLTVAVAAPETIVRIAYDVDQINAYADFVNLMSYDFHFFTKFTPFTGFNAPLYSRPDDMFSGTLNINYTANYWMAKGMDVSKIVVGIPTYGHSFMLVNSHNGSPGSPARGFGKLGNVGFVTYKDICDYIKNHTDAELEYDNDSSSPYMHDEYEWVSYENEQSVREKAQYVFESQFGGAMIYSLNSDDYTGNGDASLKFPLIRQIFEVFSGNSTN